MDKQPPTEWDRLVLFQVLGEEFQRAHRALTFPRLDAVMGSDTHQTPFWLQMMQSMLSRKFFAPGSALQLPRIANALRVCTVTDYQDDVEQVAHGIEAQFQMRVLELTDLASFDDVLYGRLLHADWNRFLRTQALSDHESGVIAFLGSGPVHTGIDAALYNVKVCHLNGWIAQPDDKPTTGQLAAAD